MDNDFSEYRDEFGQTGPLPANHGQRMPPPQDFQFGPETGKHFPDFRLRNSDKKWLDFHSDRGESKAALVFFRSAVW
jgi:hypothetical protein